MKLFRHEFEVRDYELDAQGVVNNAVYVSYLEVGRHKYCASIGLDLLLVEQRGYRFMLAALAINYHQSLVSGDVFYVTVIPRLNGRLRVEFDQEIRLLRDDSLVASATATVICLNKQTNKPCRPTMATDLFIDAT